MEPGNRWISCFQAPPHTHTYHLNICTGTVLNHQVLILSDANRKESGDSALLRVCYAAP